jgi:DNA topoisomerase I
MTGAQIAAFRHRACTGGLERTFPPHVRSRDRQPETSEWPMPRERPGDPQVVARSAGLRYVTDEMPGITRRRCGRAFAYYSPDGQLVRDEETLHRIRALAIPPAYRNVWICPLPNGHLQATGRDDAGRKQYRYHPQWNHRASGVKYGNLVEFARCLPKLRQRIGRDLKRRDLSRRTVVATVVRLLDETLIRIGNDEYAQQNGSFGLTTLRDRHVKATGRTLHFRFNGKSGQPHEIRLESFRLARLVRRCQDLPGQRLFQYDDGEGEPEAIQSHDVNDYLREVTRADVTAKHFRTWGGTVLAAIELARLGRVEGQRQRKKAIVAAVRNVAGRLGNRPATCRKYYIHPAVIAAFEAGELHELMGTSHPPGGSERSVPVAGLSAQETAVLQLLERAERNPPSPASRSGAAGARNRPARRRRSTDRRPGASSRGRTRTSASTGTARRNRAGRPPASSPRSRAGRRP